MDDVRLKFGATLNDHKLSFKCYHRLQEAGFFRSYVSVLYRIRHNLNTWEPAEVESLRCLVELFPHEPIARLSRKYRKFFTANGRTVSALNTAIHRRVKTTMARTFVPLGDNSPEVLEQSKKLAIALAAKIGMDPPRFDESTEQVDGSVDAETSPSPNEKSSTDDSESDADPSSVFVFDDDSDEVCTTDEESLTDDATSDIARTPEPAAEPQNKIVKRSRHRCRKCIRYHRKCIPCTSCRSADCFKCASCCKTGHADCSPDFSSFVFSFPDRRENDEIIPSIPNIVADSEADCSDENSASFENPIEEDCESEEDAVEELPSEEDPDKASRWGRLVHDFFSDSDSDSKSSVDADQTRKRASDKIVLIRDGVSKPTRTRHQARPGEASKSFLKALQTFGGNENDDIEAEAMDIVVEGRTAPSEEVARCPSRNCATDLFYPKTAAFIRCPKCRAEYNVDLIKTVEMIPEE